MYTHSSTHTHAYINALHTEIVSHALLFTKCAKIKIFSLFRLK